MSIAMLCELASGTFAAAAVVLFVVALVEWVLMTLFSMPMWAGYWPGRLLEFAALSLVAVIAVLLRQIREELRRPK